MAAPIEKENIVTAIVYDFETGGLDCTKHAATQISLHAVRLDTFEVMEKYNAYIMPYPKKTKTTKSSRKTLKSKYADDEEEEMMEYGEVAMKVSGITIETLFSQGKALEDVCTDICNFISRNTFKVSPANKPILVGQNPVFDLGFMQQIMVYSGMWDNFTKLVRGKKDFWGNFNVVQVDTIVLAQLAFGDNKSITTWKLEAIADRLNVELDDAHDADADVAATRDILKVLTARMRECSVSSPNIGGFASEHKEKMRDYFKI